MAVEPEDLNPDCGVLPPEIDFRQRPRRHGGSGNLVLGLMIFLVVLTIVQAILLIPLFDRDGDGDGALTAERNLPEREIRVLVAAGDPELFLKTPLDFPEADRLDEERLDEHLFPGGERHRYYLLHARHLGEGRQALNLPLVLEDGEGKSWKPLDLAAALRSHRAEIPDYLRLYLDLHVVRGARVEVPRKSSRSVLLAYPRDAEPARLARGRIDGRELTPRSIRKDVLDGLFASPETAVEDRGSGGGGRER